MDYWRLNWAYCHPIACGDQCAPQDACGDAIASLDLTPMLPQLANEDDVAETLRNDAALQEAVLDFVLGPAWTIDE